MSVCICVFAAALQESRTMQRIFGSVGLTTIVIRKVISPNLQRSSVICNKNKEVNG